MSVIIDDTKYYSIYDIENYDSFKKDYKNRLKADMVAMLTELKNELTDISWNIDMYDDDLDFECMYLSDVLKIIDKYCKGDRNDKN